MVHAHTDPSSWIGFASPWRLQAQAAEELACELHHGAKAMSARDLQWR